MYVLCRGALADCPGGVVLDLSQVDLADTKLAACLVALHKSANRSATQLSVIPSAIVANVLSVCRLERLITESDPAQE